jgi:hypothetical protein
MLRFLRVTVGAYTEEARQVLDDESDEADGVFQLGVFRRHVRVTSLLSRPQPRWGLIWQTIGLTTARFSPALEAFNSRQMKKR